MKKIILVCCCLCFLLAASACAEDVPLQTYTGSSGYQVDFPETWSVAHESADETCISDEKNNIYMIIANDFGSVEYYSLADINEMLAENIVDSLFTSYSVADSAEKEFSFRQIYSCHKDSGEQYSLDITVFRESPALKYYIIFLADSKNYDDYERIIGRIIGSFQQTASSSDLYRQIEAEREEAREEENRESEDVNNSENDGSSDNGETDDSGEQNGDSPSQNR